MSMEPWNPPARDRTAAVVVTHHPDEGLWARLDRVIPQVGAVIVVDNGPAGVTQLGSVPPGVIVIPNGRNLGIATALNQGARRAIDLGYSWILTLDQDSVVDGDLVDSLAAIYAMYPQSSKVGLLSANSRSPVSGRVARRCPWDSQPHLECTTAITSGSLISLAAYTTVGPFRDDFFIEGVDLEYCLRLRRHGYRIISSCRPLMTHAAGAREEVRFLGRTILVANHAPRRYYYLMRNFTRIVRTYFRYEPRWVVAATVGVVKMVVRVALFERDRREKFVALLRGLLDGVTWPRAPVGQI